MAEDFYLKLDSITGESKVAGHVGEMQIQTFSIGGANASSVTYSSGSGSGKVSLPGISFSKETDSASVKLFLAMCKGTHIAKGLLTVVKAGGGGQPYLKYDLTEVMITSYNLDGSAQNHVERISLSYASITMTYLAQNADGTMVASGIGGWDLRKNAAL